MVKKWKYRKNKKTILSLASAFAIAVILFLNIKVEDNRICISKNEAYAQSVSVGDICCNNFDGVCTWTDSEGNVDFQCKGAFIVHGYAGLEEL